MWRHLTGSPWFRHSLEHVACICIVFLQHHPWRAVAIAFVRAAWMARPFPWMAPACAPVDGQLPARLDLGVHVRQLHKSFGGRYRA